MEELKIIKTMITSEKPHKTAPLKKWLQSDQLLTGGEATAHAMRQIDPDVVPVYPITPQTPIIETFSKFVADGLASTHIMNVESEHSAMSAAIGSAVAGGRTMTATASQGLALMVENIYIAASMRAPIVMAVGNRALSGPINIHCDHSDMMLARDSGAIQFFVENAQEVYDFMLMAPRLAEHPEILLPVLIGQDGFTITHSAEPVSLLDDEEVKDWIGEYQIPYPLLDRKKLTTQGPFDMPDYYFEHKMQQQAAMDGVFPKFKEVAEAYEEWTGRYYSVTEPYYLDDAEYAIVVMGSTAGTAKEVVDELREKGQKVGLLKIRGFRPFPSGKIARELAHVKRAAVLDRSMSFGSVPPVFGEVSQSLYGSGVDLFTYVYGLGGRDIYPREIRRVFDDLNTLNAQPENHYLGLRS